MINGTTYNGHAGESVALLLVMAISLNPAAHSQPPETAIARCPDSPNCVSSSETENGHHTAPFELAVGFAAGWSGIQKAVADLPRTTVVRDEGYYIHVECRSRLFRFVDDLELELDPTTGVVGVRSASRAGYSDFGINRKRVERLRRMLKDRGIIF